MGSLPYILDISEVVLGPDQSSPRPEKAECLEAFGHGFELRARPCRIGCFLPG